MRIDFDDRLDKEYPEPPECEVNEQQCSFSVDAVCHHCGTQMCDDCAVGVRHQPRPSKYEHETNGEQTTVQLHCPDCLDAHTANMQIVGAGGGAAALGLLFVLIGNINILVLSLLGLVLLGVGGWLLKHEYELKERHNEEYGPSSLF